MNESNFGSATLGARESSTGATAELLTTLVREAARWTRGGEREAAPPGELATRRFSAWHRGHYMPEVSERVEAGPVGQVARA